MPATCCSSITCQARVAVAVLGPDRLELAEGLDDRLLLAGCRGTSRRASPGLATGSKVGLAMYELTLPPMRIRRRAVDVGPADTAVAEALVLVAGERVLGLVVVVVEVEDRRDLGHAPRPPAVDARRPERPTLPRIDVGIEKGGKMRAWRTAPRYPTARRRSPPAWLTEALASSVPDVEVTAVEVLDQHSGTTGRLRLGLEHAPGHNGPDSVFVKLPPFEESQRKLVAATDMGRREARFYEGSAAEAPLRIPGLLFAAHGEEPHRVRDGARGPRGLRVQVHQPPGDRGPRSTGGKVVEALARLHARFWDDPRFDDELAWVQPAMRGRVRRRVRRPGPSRCSATTSRRCSPSSCRLYVGTTTRPSPRSGTTASGR